MKLYALHTSAICYAYFVRDVRDGCCWSPQDADIAAAALTITAERETVVDFSFPYWEEPSGVLIRRPAEGSKLLNLLKPLQWSVWLTVIVEVLLASVVIYACTACANHLAARQRDTTMTSFENCLWYSFGALVNQSMCKLHRNLSIMPLGRVGSCHVYAI